MQTAGRKKRLTIDNLIILNSIIENERQNKNKKWFDKLWLKDSEISVWLSGNRCVSLYG